MSHHPERTARNVRPVNQPPSFINVLRILQLYGEAICVPRSDRLFVFLRKDSLSASATPFCVPRPRGKKESGALSNRFLVWHR